MKIRWRQHEVLFVSMAGLLLIIRFVLIRMNEAQDLLNQEGVADASWSLIITHFIEHQFLPQAGPWFIVYAVYLLINLYVIPQLILKRKYIVTGILLSIVIWMSLLLVFAFTYYKQDLFYILRYSARAAHIHSFRNGASVIAISFLLYGAYVYFREAIIKWANQKQTNHSFAITLINNITGVIFLYLGILVLLFAFDLFRNEVLGVFYLFFLLPAIILCFINIYWLFPWQKKSGIIFNRFIWWLTLAPTLLSILSWICFLVFAGNANLFFAIAVWGVLMLLVTPVSWLLYVQQREKLEAMLNLQLSLGKTSANLQFLRSQINPHFLFNALNTIYGTALQENAERTSEAVQRLGDMMRFMLEENQQDRISLDKEMAYLTNYIDLQKLRTSVSPDIDISFANKTQQCSHMIAPMLLIPFVENAFKHGISLKEKSWIKINISCDTETIYFDVYNSVHPRPGDDPEKNRSGIGLENVKQRLSLIYPNQHELHIRSTSTEYFVHLTLQP